MKPAGEVIRPYGDRRDDGVVQLSFTLPVPLSEKAKAAAAEFVRKMGFHDVKVAAAEPVASTPSTTRWGGEWYCPADGQQMVETDGAIGCPRCGRYLPGTVIYGLIELHTHTSPRGFLNRRRW